MTPLLGRECENAVHFRCVSPTRGHSDWKNESLFEFKVSISNSFARKNSFPTSLDKHRRKHEGITRSTLYNPFIASEESLFYLALFASHK